MIKDNSMATISGNPALLATLVSTASDAFSGEIARIADFIASRQAAIHISVARVFEVEAIWRFHDWASQNGSTSARVDGRAFAQDVAGAGSQTRSQLAVVSHWSYILKHRAHGVPS